MRFVLSLLGSIVLAAVAAPTATAANCRAGAHVFLDGNGNGRRDAGERGLAGMQVSDGERIAITDRRGRYVLDVGNGQTLFLIKPAGYALHPRADGLPDSWLNVQYQAGAPLRYGGVPLAAQRCRDFPLLRDHRPASAPLDVLVFGDPQPKSLIDVDYYARDIVLPLLGRQQARLGIVLGDLVDDDLALYPAMKAIDARLGIPMLHAPGNHDLDFDATDDAGSLASYRHAYGPDTRAWEEAQANFIVLDDVIYLPGQRPAYIGGLRERQFAFLENYLATAARDRLLVLALHIPLFDPVPGVESFRRADRERLFALLRPFHNVLVLSAHAHAQQHVFHGAATGWQGENPLHEYNVGASCGGYWTGPKDGQGIPEATMSDGTPNGHASLRIANGVPVLKWHVARAAGDPQMALHAPKVLRRGSYPGVGLYANVFMGRPDTVVAMRVDEGEWQPMRRVLQADPALLAENARDDAAPTLRAYNRLPEASASAHLWRAALPTDLALGEHRLTVRADVAGAGPVEAHTSYRLLHADP